MLLAVKLDAKLSISRGATINASKADVTFRHKFLFRLNDRPDKDKWHVAGALLHGYINQSFRCIRLSMPVKHDFVVLHHSGCEVTRF